MALPKIITIRVIDTDDKHATIHYLRNFGEDIWRRVECTGLGDIGGLATVDAARDELVIRIKHNREAKRVTDLVRELLQQHALTGRTTMTLA